LINFLVSVRLNSFSFSFSFSSYLQLLDFFISFIQRCKSLGEFLPMIERFLHKRRKDARNNNVMAEEHTLKEHATPSTDETHAIIVYPMFKRNNFEIKPALLNLVQQNQFSGSPTEDLNLHIATFLRLSGALKANQDSFPLLKLPN
jgi:hypothetical protein